MDPDVSVILVNYNTEGYLDGCIGSIYNQTKSCSFEVIVVDNASGHNPERELAEKYPEVRYFRNDTNLGFGAANNIGVSGSKGEYLFFLNPDTVLLNDCIGIFHRFLSDGPSHPNAAACGGNLVNADGSPAPAWGNLPTLKLLLSDLGFRKLYRNYYDNRLATYGYCDFTESHAVPYISGADLFIRKDIFQKVGGFNEHYFMYYEDADLCHRLRRGGYSTHLLPEAKILHLESQSTRNGNEFNYRKYELLEKSKYLYFKKNHSFIAAHIAKDLQLIALLTYALIPNTLIQNPTSNIRYPKPSTRNLLRITLHA